MSYKLFLDDERRPEHVTWVRLPEGPYKIVRNYQEFTRYIERRGLPDFVTFDHDLAAEHYAGWAAGRDEVLYETFKEHTGYHCAEWLVHYCINHNLPLPPFEVHSMNQVGRQNIRRVLDPANFKRMRELIHNI